MRGEWVCWRDASHPVAASVFGWPQCTICLARPPYYERAEGLRDDLVLEVYVPVGDAPARIAPGSAIVGQAPQDERITVHYEGWVHGAAQYAHLDARGQWQAGVEHAAGRLVCAYPTAATAHLPRQTLKPIGTYHPTTRALIVNDEEALDAWLNPR